MKKLLLAVAALFCLTVGANAQCIGVFPANTVCGTVSGGVPKAVDASIFSASSTAIKTPVTVVATSNITLSGGQTIDGVAVAQTTPRTRVLAVGQSSASQNGIWEVNSGAWTRPSDWATGEVVQGTQVKVTQGTISSGMIYTVTTAGAITVGSTNIAFSAAEVATQYSIGGASGVWLAGLVTPVVGPPRKQAADWTWGSTADIALWQTETGLWPGKVYNGQAISKSFDSSTNNSDPGAIPNNGLYVTAVANGTNNFVNAITAVGYCKTDDSGCSGFNSIALSDPALTNVKLVAAEFDTEYSAGQTAGTGAGGVFSVIFNAASAGPAFQSSGVSGTWTNGLACYAIDQACIAPGAGETMSAVLDTGGTVTYTSDAIVVHNTDKIRFVGTATAHAKIYNSSGNILRFVDASSGLAIRNNADSADLLTVSDTGQTVVLRGANDGGFAVKTTGSHFPQISFYDTTAGGFTAYEASNLLHIGSVDTSGNLVADVFKISSTQGGTAAVPALGFGTAATGFYIAAANSIGITNNGTATWSFFSNGNFLPLIDNTLAIGNTTNRVKSINIGQFAQISIQASNPSTPATGFINIYALMGGGGTGICSIRAQSSTATVDLGVIAGGGC